MTHFEKISLFITVVSTAVYVAFSIGELKTDVQHLKAQNAQIYTKLIEKSLIAER